MNEYPELQNISQLPFFSLLDDNFMLDTHILFWEFLILQNIKNEVNRCL